MVDETEFDIMDAEENEELADCLSEAFGIEVNDMSYEDEEYQERMEAEQEERNLQAEIAALVTALDMLKDKYMAVQYPMMWLHDVVKIDPEVEQADRLTNKYKHKGE